VLKLRERKCRIPKKIPWAQKSAFKPVDSYQFQIGTRSNGARRDAVTRMIENKFVVQSFMTSTTTRARETALEFGMAPHAFPATQAPLEGVRPNAKRGTFYKIVLPLSICAQIILRECCGILQRCKSPQRDRAFEYRLKSTSPLLRQVFTGGRQRQLPMLDAPDRDQMLGNTPHSGSLSANNQYFETVVVI